VLGNGDAPLGYHGVNIGLHVVNVVLVYFRMMRSVSVEAGARPRSSHASGLPTHGDAGSACV
jgi:hypothetical protein